MNRLESINTVFGRFVAMETENNFLEHTILHQCYRSLEIGCIVKSMKNARFVKSLLKFIQRIRKIDANPHSLIFISFYR